MDADPPFFGGPGRRRGSLRKLALLGLLLAVPAVVVGASSSLSPPEDRAPFQIVQGEDLPGAQALGAAGPLQIDEDRGAFEVAIHVPAGARVTIDDLVTLALDDHVVSVGMVAYGDATAPQAGTTVLRLWTGDQPPGQDTDPQVCQVVGRDDGRDPAREGCGSGPVHVQLILERPEGAPVSGDLHLVTTAVLAR